CFCNRRFDISRCSKCRLYEYAGKIRYADEAQDDAKVFALQIVTLGACAGTVSTAPCVDCNGSLIVNQPLITLGRTETERQSRLYNNVNEMLQDIWNAKVPHWQRQQIPVGCLEAFNYIFDPLPGSELFRRMLFAVQDGVLSVDGVPVKRRQFR